MTLHKIPRKAITRIALYATVAFVFLAQSAIADYYEYDYIYTADRMSREHRLAGDVDDWIERGDSTVTASPIFHDGIRLAAWANEYEADETFEFGIASAVYLFEIPRGTRFIEVKVRYKGEAHDGYLDEYGKVAGRVWIRNTEKEREYLDDRDADTLYGDTFVLRADRRSETIKISAANHVDDGLLELHVVAQAGEMIDVNYVDVTAKLRQPKTRVVHRYVKEYEWNPWHNYTYCYFYAGPHYHVTNYGYYVRWSYPIHDRHYILIRANYGRYLTRYRRRHGVAVYHYYRPVRNTRIRVYDRDRSRTRKRLTRWTNRDERVRHEYSRSRDTKTRRERSAFDNTRSRVRQTIEKHRREPALVDREIQSRRVSLKRRTDADRTDRSSRSTMKTQISTRTQRSNERAERVKRVRTQPQVNKTRTSTRSQKTAPSKERKTEVKRKRTETKSSPSRTKSRKNDDDDDDDDDEKEERAKKRETRKKRR